MFSKSFRKFQIKFPIQFIHSNNNFNELVNGYHRFRAKYFENPNNTLFKNLVKNGQSPKAMIITCSDSRVDPSIILNCSPGDLFVFRNVANLVPPCDRNPKHHGTSAALEFAVEILKIPRIIVLGHSHCGGIKALLTSPNILTSPKAGSFIKSWMNIASEAKKKGLLEYKDYPLEQQAKICEEQSLVISLKNLHTFPWINEKVYQGVLSLHAWRFDLHTGIIQQYNTNLCQFEDLALETPDQKAEPSAGSFGIP